MTTMSREQEFEGVGMAALVGALLLPGVFWIARGKSAAAIAGRTILVAGVIAAAVTFEGLVDDAAEAVAGAVSGSSK
jgi:hypothetical protein